MASLLSFKVCNCSFKFAISAAFFPLVPIILSNSLVISSITAVIASTVLKSFSFNPSFLANATVSPFVLFTCVAAICSEDVVKSLTIAAATLPVNCSLTKSSILCFSLSDKFSLSSKAFCTIAITDSDSLPL